MEGEEDVCRGVEWQRQAVLYVLLKTHEDLRV